MRVVHIDYDARVTDFKTRLDAAIGSFRDGVQAHTLKVANEARIDVKKTLEVGNENRDTLKLESQWTTSTLV